MQVFREPIQNRLLRALPAAVMDRLRPSLWPVRLDRGETLSDVTRPSEHLYFVNRGLVSLVKTMRDGRSIEAGAVGVEGLVNAWHLLGVGSTALESIVQVPGGAFRIEREVFSREMDADDSLRRMIEDYLRFRYDQLAQNAACSHLHSLEARCCRWLLTAHDSALSDVFVTTHETLAMMLGVRRSGVSIAARTLKEAGLINYTRGEVTILDRQGLEQAACECYATLQDEIESVFAASATAPPGQSGAGGIRHDSASFS